MLHCKYCGELYEEETEYEHECARIKKEKRYLTCKEAYKPEKSEIIGVQKQFKYKHHEE